MKQSKGKEESHDIEEDQGFMINLYRIEPFYIFALLGLTTQKHHFKRHKKEGPLQGSHVCPPQTTLEGPQQKPKYLLLSFHTNLFFWKSDRKIGKEWKTLFARFLDQSTTHRPGQRSPAESGSRGGTWELENPALEALEGRRSLVALFSTVFFSPFFTAVGFFVVVVTFGRFLFGFLLVSFFSEVFLGVFWGCWTFCLLPRRVSINIQSLKRRTKELRSTRPGCFFLKLGTLPQSYQEEAIIKPTKRHPKLRVLYWLDLRLTHPRAPRCGDSLYSFNSSTTTKGSEFLMPLGPVPWDVTSSNEVSWFVLT